MANAQSSSWIADREWITDRAWISGLVGAICVVALAVLYNRNNVLDSGVSLFGISFTSERTDTLIAALVITTVVMLAVELLRLILRERGSFLSIDPLISSGHYGRFLLHGIWSYLCYLALLWIVIGFFHTAGEYGFSRQAPFYQPWFRILDLTWTLVLFGGLPYILLTRALKHDPIADRRDLGALVGQPLLYCFNRYVAGRKTETFIDDPYKKNVRGLLVKLFFTPLMTVFFLDQFPHLVSNVGYLLGGLPDNIQNGTYSHRTLNGDLFHISASLIFSIDVALAWCGYVISSRWVDNQTVSAEPTMLGWVVCLICYPPFQMYLGLYYSPPADSEILNLPNAWVVTFFTLLMVLSYLVYMSVTMWFGVRFSNLTHRGIIRKGPFALVRHPAYASKNLSWWLVMFPSIVYHATNQGYGIALSQTLGLVVMTYVYYLRSITEERHLSMDPRYQEYCEKVKYRFIPKIL